MVGGNCVRQWERCPDEEAINGSTLEKCQSTKGPVWARRK